MKHNIMYVETKLMIQQMSQQDRPLRGSIHHNGGPAESIYNDNATIHKWFQHGASI